MSYQYPLLNKVFEHFKGHQNNVSDIYLVCCQHILEPQLKMFELLVDFGFEPSKIVLLGKIYSTNNDVVREIEDIGINVIQPKFSGVSFDLEHKNNCESLLKEIPEDAKVILLDDGAELIKTFQERKNVLFAVEQTSSGFRKLEGNQLSFPVVNVARSSTKLIQESPLIARLCFERINEYLSNKSIDKPKLLIVGLGPIGEAIFEIFKQNDFDVSGFDIKEGHKELLSIIISEKPDVVIGATGSSILSKDEIDNLVSDREIHFISVSSSDREFPVAYFRNNNEVHKDVIYKNITFVNNGFPITFKGNRYELTPVEIEKTVCLLGGAIADGVVSGFKEKGLVNVSEILEQVINQ